jgi:hypothetical protein
VPLVPNGSTDGGRASSPLNEAHRGVNMIFIVTKYAVTALVVVIASEIAKRSDKIGALIVSLPLVTVMVMVWLYLENQGTQKVANHAYYTFWYVLPTLPMFLLVPYLLGRGLNFWLALLSGLVLTAVLFVALATISRQFGLDLEP